MSRPFGSRGFWNFLIYHDYLVRDRADPSRNFFVLVFGHWGLRVFLASLFRLVMTADKLLLNSIERLRETPIVTSVILSRLSRFPLWRENSNPITAQLN